MYNAKRHFKISYEHEKAQFNLPAIPNRTLTNGMMNLNLDAVNSSILEHLLQLQGDILVG